MKAMTATKESAGIERRKGMSSRACAKRMDGSARLCMLFSVGIQLKEEMVRIGTENREDNSTVEHERRGALVFGGIPAEL